VRIERTSASLDVRVESVGGAGHRPASADGRGLLGMRERLTVYGGTLHSGPTSDGGYEVVAHVPLHDRANEPV
jgi:signal transduction histidine kinase